MGCIFEPRWLSSTTGILNYSGHRVHTLAFTWIFGTCLECTSLILIAHILMRIVSIFLTRVYIRGNSSCWLCSSYLWVRIHLRIFYMQVLILI